MKKMTLEQQVTNKHLSWRLEHDGVPQESEFYWFTKDRLWTERELRGKTMSKDRRPYSAFTVAELGVLLPNEKENGMAFNSGLAIDGWFCEIKSYRTMPCERVKAFFGFKTEADARGTMLAWLIEAEYINPEEL